MVEWTENNRSVYTFLARWWALHWSREHEKKSGFRGSLHTSWIHRVWIALRYASIALSKNSNVQVWDSELKLGQRLSRQSTLTRWQRPPCTGEIPEGDHNGEKREGKRNQGQALSNDVRVGGRQEKMLQRGSCQRKRKQYRGTGVLVRKT